MRKEVALINFLRRLVELLAEQAERDTKFAKKLEMLLTPISEPTQRVKRMRRGNATVEIPDIYAEWHARGEEEFHLWLRDEPVEVLRALIREHELDPARRTVRWKEQEKLSAYIVDQLQVRLSRGSKFMRS